MSTSAGETEELYATADFCLIPMAAPDSSVAVFIAECQRVLEKSGLVYSMHGYGTNLEGPWSKVSDAIRACHAAVHAQGIPRIATDIRIGTRADRPGYAAGKLNENKVKSVEAILQAAHMP